MPFVLCSIFYSLNYTNNFLTIAEIVFPSACPPICAEANPITFPIEAMPVAPIQRFCGVPVRAGNSLGGLKTTKTYETGFYC